MDADGADNPALPAVLRCRYPVVEFVLGQMRPGLAAKNVFLFLYCYFFHYFFWLLLPSIGTIFLLQPVTSIVY